jgi:transposase
MQITTVGLDLAKNVFQVHGVDKHGKAVLRKQLRRDQGASFFANLPACVVGMEACSSAHHWARKLQSMGHTARLMAPQFVKPYVKSNKNDAADAEAICEAVSRPTMRFVPIKNVEQQAVMALHRVRQGFVKARTAQANQIRGLLGRIRARGAPRDRLCRQACARADRGCVDRTAWHVPATDRQAPRSPQAVAEAS